MGAEGGDTARRRPPGRRRALRDDDGALPRAGSAADGEDPEVLKEPTESVESYYVSINRAR